MVAFFYPPPFLGRRLKLVRTASFTAWTPTTSGTTKTAASVDIGAVASDRFVVVVIGRHGTDGAANLTGITVGGVSASLVYNTGAAFNVWGALVPSGATADISITYDTPVANVQTPCQVFVLTGYSSTIPVAAEQAASAVGASPRSLSLTATGSVGGVRLLFAGSVTGVASNMPTPTLSPANNQALAQASGSMSALVSNDGQESDGSSVAVSAGSSWSGGATGGQVRLFNVVWK